MIKSAERTTGMGAAHRTELLYEGQWYPLSQFPSAQHVGRKDGFELWELDAWAKPHEVRAFHRSNSGAVHFTEGMVCNGYEGTDTLLEAE